jgi:hypothetical protein
MNGRGLLETGKTTPGGKEDMEMICTHSTLQWEEQDEGGHGRGGRDRKSARSANSFCDFTWWRWKQHQKVTEHTSLHKDKFV